MTTTTTEIRPRRAPRLSLSWIAPAILAIAALVLVVNLSRSMPGREDITVVNRTGATVTMDVTGDPPDGTVGIGTFDPKSRETAEAVIDQGDVWRFELTVGPDRIAEIRRTADQLRAAHWRVTIPADAADGLEPLRRAG
jgi:hypothetical protein